MRAVQIESWALDVVERVTSHHPVEDSRVELKSEWPTDHAAAARRIAGHCNSARGDSVLWVVGVDEKRGVVTGASKEDLASWWPQVCKSFDDMEPGLVDLVVPTKQGIVVALLFDSSRAPFVVKNPAAGKPGSGPVESEVPWREGTSVRSARRFDLVRLLLSSSSCPSFEPVSGVIQKYAISSPFSTSKTLRDGKTWSATAYIYIAPQSERIVVLPFHKIETVLRHRKFDRVIESNRRRFESASKVWPVAVSHETITSVGVESSATEIIVRMAGMLVVHADFELNGLDFSGSDYSLGCRFQPPGGDWSVGLEIPLEVVRQE